MQVILRTATEVQRHRFALIAYAGLRPNEVRALRRRDVQLRWENRGCMSQNGADWLARHGEDHLAILRFFYGLDLELADLRGARPVPAPPSPGPKPAPSPRAPGPAAPGEPSSSDDGAAFLAVAGAGLSWILSR